LNFLAHIALSGDDAKVQSGNFIGDFVKGSSFKQYDSRVQKGILMHREIDSFADNAWQTKEAKKFLQPSYGRYAGVACDVVFDHFLSVNWHMFYGMPLQQSIDQFHTNLWNCRFLFPERSRKLLPSLIYHGYLRSYVSLYGIQNVLRRMAMRTSLPAESVSALRDIRLHYTELNDLFLDFYPEVQSI